MYDVNVIVVSQNVYLKIINNKIVYFMQVLLTVVRGLQIPIRCDSDWKSNNPDGITTVRPFVEVVYKNNRQRTFTADGANPTWNHQIQIPLKLVFAILYKLNLLIFFMVC